MGLAHDAGAGLLKSNDHIGGCALLGILVEKGPVAERGLRPLDVEVVLDCDSESTEHPAASSCGGFCGRVRI